MGRCRASGSHEFGCVEAQIILAGRDQVFTLCALAKHLHNCARAACAALPQSLHKLHQLALFGCQPDAPARTAFRIEGKRRAVRCPERLNQGHKVIAKRACRAWTDMGGRASQRV